MEFGKPKVDDVVEEFISLVGGDEYCSLVRIQMRREKSFALALRPSFLEFGAENISVPDISKKISLPNKHEPSQLTQTQVQPHFRLS